MPSSRVSSRSYRRPRCDKSSTASSEASDSVKTTACTSLSGTPETCSPRASCVAAFVQVVVAGPTGVSNEARRAVRVQAAKSSAAARKRTIARKLALQRAKSLEHDREPDKFNDDDNDYYDKSNGNSGEKAENDGHDQPAQRSNHGQRLSTRPHLINHTAATGIPSPRSVSSSPCSKVAHLEPSNWAYPTTLRHREIPALIEYFLTYFAPAANSSANYSGREMFRMQMWPQALQHDSLFHACLLVAGSHAHVTRAFHIPIELLSQAKHAAIASIIAAVSRSLPNEQVDEPVIVAIALLGGWELEYGDPSMYETHMRGLRTIVHLRDGFSPHADHITDEINKSPPGLESLSTATVAFILSVTQNLAMFAWQEPYFPPPDHSSSQPPNARLDAFPEGIEELRQQHLCHNSLLRIIADLDLIDPSKSGGEMVRLDKIQQELAGWDGRRASTARFCPLQTDFEDGLNLSSHRLMRLASLALCSCLRAVMERTAPRMPPFLYADALVVQAEVLVGTVYDEVAFWALFIICAATARCERSHIRTLRRLQLDLTIHSWAALQARLGRYAYSAPALDVRAYALWEAVISSSAAAVIDDPAFDLPEPTRYAKGIVHPTLQIGAAISASELAHLSEMSGGVLTS